MTNAEQEEDPMGWFKDAAARAKARLAAAPPGYRPVVIARPNSTRESTRFVCRCGHPGMGCYCP